MLQLGIQYWTSRGFGVVDVNYGGSTGYGRAYREQLDGNWGIVDLDDCEAAARWLADQGRVDPERLASGAARPAATRRWRCWRSATPSRPVPATTAWPTWRPWRSRPTSSRAATSTG